MRGCLNNLTQSFTSVTRALSTRSSGQAFGTPVSYRRRIRLRFSHQFLVLVMLLLLLEQKRREDACALPKLSRNRAQLSIAFARGAFGVRCVLASLSLSHAQG